MSILQARFSKETTILEALFGEISQDRWRRLDEIFERSEEFWHQALDMIPERRIKYMMIAEAPPWSPFGEVEYFYNPLSKSRTFLNAICNAFFEEHIYTTRGIDKALSELGQRGFLLCDSIPFAMNYSTGNKRARQDYRRLVEMTTTTYMEKKLTESGIKWADTICVAFGVYRNARVIIDKYRGQFPLGCSGRMIPINEQLIAVNKAGYPCRDRLKTIFKI